MKRILLRSDFATYACEVLPAAYLVAVYEAIRRLEAVDEIERFAKPLDASGDETLAFADRTGWYFVSVRDGEGGLTPPDDYRIEDEDLIVILVIAELPQGLSPLPMYRVIDVATAASPDDQGFIPRLQAAVEQHRRLETPPPPPDDVS